jgi:hypothetical protein
LVSEIFDQELNRIVNELAPDTDDAVIEMYREARQVSEQMIHSEEFDPI